MASQQDTTPFYDDGEWISIEANNDDNESPGDAEDLEDDPNDRDEYPEIDPDIPSDKGEENEGDEGEENDGDEEIGDQLEISTSSQKQNVPQGGRPSRRFRQFWLAK
jgi:hypothetical protein